MTVIRQDYQIEYEITMLYPSSFPFEFGAADMGHIKVYDIDPSLPESDYGHRTLLTCAEIYPNAAGLEYGGFVLTPTPLEIGHVLHIRRETPIIQQTAYQTQREMNPESVEAALDYLTYIIQEGPEGSSVETLKNAIAGLTVKVAELDAEKADAGELAETAARIQDAVDNLGRDKLSADHVDQTASPDPHPQYLRKNNLPIASEQSAGVVKVDGVSASVKADGTLLILGGGSGTGGEGGTTDHQQLTNRNALDQHNSVALTHGSGTDKVALNTLLETFQSEIAGKIGSGALQTALNLKADKTVATQQADGLMSKTDKANLDSLQAVSGNYLPLSGGTISGNLAVSGTLTLAGTNIATAVSNLSTRMISAESGISGLTASVGSLGAMAYVADAPRNDKAYARQGGAWAEVQAQGGGAIVGEIRLLPFRKADLPAGWYLCDGQQFALSSAQGTALSGLPAAMKSDWGIAVASGYIGVPDLFADGMGYFLRPVDNVNRFPGNRQEDAMQNIAGKFSLAPSVGVVWHTTGSGTSTLTGPFHSAANKNYGLTGSNVGSNATGDLDFDASRCVRTDSESRPKNIGMTPAIYLGV